MITITDQDAHLIAHLIRTHPIMRLDAPERPRLVDIADALDSAAARLREIAATTNDTGAIQPPSEPEK